MLVKLLLLFTLLPIVELALLLYLADATSWQLALGIVLATGILGAMLARRQGWRTSQRIREQLARGPMPGDALLDALLILIAGALLVTPGVLTDAVGFLLLIPPCRRLIKRRLVARFQLHQANFDQPS